MVADMSALVSTKATATLHAVASLLLESGNGLKPNVEEAVNAASQQMDLSTAVKLMENKELPDDVSNLIQKVNGSAEFSEESMAKARIALNELIEKAWIELDDKLFQCKGFEDMNRESYAQANRDIMRLVAQINDLERIEASAIQGIATKEQEILTVEAQIAQETMLYNTEYAENKADLSKRQNDVDVFQFVLVFTKCPDSTSLAQQNVKVCQFTSGPHAGHKTLVFADKSIAARYDKLLTTGTRTTMDKLLRSVEPVPSGSLLQTDRQPFSMGFDLKSERISCGPTPPDCALLHDKLSLLWGEFKDKVDELTMTMLANQIEFNEIKSNLNSQITLLTAAKAKFGMLLAEVRSSMVSLRQEIKEKEVVKTKRDAEYYEYMAKCKRRISWILGQDMCAMKTVRNAVLIQSTACPSAAIQDCNMGDWKGGSCSVSCDNTCTPSEPFKCGGWQEMMRTPLANGDACGVKCPSGNKLKRCGQFVCPINCEMSVWSEFSSCTADCGGGLQSKTRSIIVKPQNGGMSCNTVTESRPCNTGSCDRDCTLTAWKKWKPCSVACGGGMQQRVKHVLIPTRGDGKCPTASSEFRLEKRICNSKVCVGDEVCIADQDLIIAIDGSGSLQEAGFGILKSWVNSLLGRYKTEYYGQDKVRLGIVLFGNGVVMSDGKTVSPAINSQPLTGDSAAVVKAVNDLPFKKGFTNMAQAFAMAGDMFDKGSRAGAQHAVMIVTDGKPSFSFMTGQMAEQLQDKGIQRFFVVVSQDAITDKSMSGIKNWASQPWEANLLHVPGGLSMLEADPNMWATKALTKFCPSSHSPSTEIHTEGTYGFTHVKDNGWCGTRGSVELSSNVPDSQECSRLAASRGSFSFILGKGVRKGYCYGGDNFDKAQYTKWRLADSKLNPECKTGWTASELYDFYAIEPHQWRSPVWFCVASIKNNKVKYFRDLPAAKTELNAPGCAPRYSGNSCDPNNRQMICEMSVAGAKGDPHEVGGENQGGGPSTGFYKFWWMTSPT